MANPLMRYIGDQAQHGNFEHILCLIKVACNFVPGRENILLQLPEFFDNWEFSFTTHSCSQASSNIIKYNAHHPSEIQMTKKSTSNCYKREPNEPLLPQQRLCNYSPENCTGLFTIRDQNISLNFKTLASSGNCWFYVCI